MAMNMDTKMVTVIPSMVAMVVMVVMMNAKRSQDTFKMSALYLV